ncbi:MAG: hypothetical protein CSB48_02850 [Proteobacteria bacterium]|nr:MAG: hypothetical protein CSB48_02850 [Pseudomonadota bacterium]
MNQHSGTAFDRCTLEEVREALDYIDSHDRDTWVRMGMAIKSEFGSAGFDVWDAWGQLAANYNASASKATWRSIGVSGANASVRIGTLFKEAMNNGWSARPAQFTDQERAAREKEWADRRQLRQQEWAAEEALVRDWHSRIATFADEIWSLLKSSGKSPYLGKKKIKDYGIRFARAALIVVTNEESKTVRLITGRQNIESFYKSRDKSLSFLHIKPGVIAVPLRDMAGNLWNIQFIFQAGKKRFLKCGRKSGLFHVLGNVDTDGPLIFAEGYSSGASVHQALNHPVVITMDCGNLLTVAEQWRERYPDRLFIYAADNDLATDGNPGLTHARQAADELGGFVWLANMELTG